MKKILVVINSLTIGGSEKSLISLLNMIDYKKYSVDLQMIKIGEEFDKYIPKEVNLLPIPEYYKYIEKGSSVLNLSKFYTRVKTAYNLRKNLKSKNPVNTQQTIYLSQRNTLENNLKEYDVAIAFAQGFPTYYVVEKVSAKKKIAWINCDYVNTMYDKDLDYKFYKKIDKIIAVSKTIEKSIISMKKGYETKLEVILDIVNPELIKKMSLEYDKELFQKDYLNIVTVGRIAYAKGHERVVKTAKILKDKGYKFKWHIVGDGPDRKELERLIDDADVNNYIVLWGNQSNPYPFMLQSDIYIQPSSKEGFGLTVVEAKILKRPIICTNFNTAPELIENEVDGLIVGFEPEDIFLGIKRLLNDERLKAKILNNLENKLAYDSRGELKKIIKLIEE
ncbi:glycosyltransferase [Cetobacterium somerae]|uniref:glycosyltransferase n=1 Tax=Cetobacterium somerae TaxID=188913 RepID=UPI00211E832A|nr:glycosyltransferase [Cetobacterium somerae]MCQ9626457.1 glycosyltransferase [Cetobacterium somerae]